MARHSNSTDAKRSAKVARQRTPMPLSRPPRPKIHGKIQLVKHKTPYSS